MAAGIVSYGAYVPMYRLSLATIAQTWGKQSGKGEKAVANWDEDSLTMAVEATIDCLGSQERKSVDRLYLATTTAPYLEKQNASIIAEAIDMRRDVLTADITGSLRGGTIALQSALDAINAGSVKRCVLSVSDCRAAAPSSELERSLGDGAAALLLGGEDVAVEVEGSYGISSSFIDTWRRSGDEHVLKWEDRFIIEEGYIPHMRDAVSRLFEKYKMGPKDISKAVLYAYTAKSHGDIARLLGFAPEQVQDPLISIMGHTGAASVPMMLVSALEESKPGDRILVANYGDGADAFILRVNDRIEEVRERRGIKKHVASKMMLSSYGKFLQFRNSVQGQKRFEADPYTSLPMSWRDRNWILSGRGSKCRRCGNTLFPPQRVCNYCQAQDDFDEVRLSDRKGELFTYSSDNLGAWIDPPGIYAIVDLEGGGRFSTTITDRDPDAIRPGMPVEMTFRRIHEGKGIHNYFWKCRPVRG